MFALQPFGHLTAGVSAGVAIPLRLGLQLLETPRVACLFVRIASRREGVRPVRNDCKYFCLATYVK